MITLSVDEGQPRTLTATYVLTTTVLRQRLQAFQAMLIVRCKHQHATRLLCRHMIKRITIKWKTQTPKAFLFVVTCACSLCVLSKNSNLSVALFSVFCQLYLKLDSRALYAFIVETVCLLQCLPSEALFHCWLCCC